MKSKKKNKSLKCYGIWSFLHGANIGKKMVFFFRSYLLYWGTFFPCNINFLLEIIRKLIFFFRWVIQWLPIYKKIHLLTKTIFQFLVQVLHNMCPNVFFIVPENFLRLFFIFFFIEISISCRKPDGELFALINPEVLEIKRRCCFFQG